MLRSPRAVSGRTEPQGANSGGSLALERRTARAFTLIELLAVMTIIGILSSLAVPRFSDTIERARVAKAIGDLRAITVELLSLDSLPPTLAAINRHNMLDPWGRPYQYLKFTCPGGGGEGGGGRGGGGRGAGAGGGRGNCVPADARKDRFLVPINSQFDLYSLGRDGSSAPPLTAKASRDDVIVANDGGYIGLARNY